MSFANVFTNVFSSSCKELMSTLSKLALMQFEVQSVAYDPKREGYMAVLKRQEDRPDGGIDLLGYSTVTVDVPIRAVNNTKVAMLPLELGAGDCRMAAGATLTLTEQGTGSFTSLVKTNHTHTKDYWHQSFIIYMSDGTKGFTISEHLGPAMSENDEPQWHTFEFSDIKFDKGVYKFISKLTWVGGG